MILNTLEQLRALLLKSGLPHQDVYDLILVFSYLVEGERKNLLKTLQEKPDWIKQLSGAMKQKKKALASGNREIWKTYIASEVQVLAAA